jgi:hypothetical protein
MSLPDPSTVGAATAHHGMEHIMGSKKEKSRCESLICNGFIHLMAEWTGLEPATPGVTGRYSNQLNYHSW